jgi:hypothetical protein
VGGLPVGYVSSLKGVMTHYLILVTSTHPFFLDRTAIVPSLQKKVARKVVAPNSETTELHLKTKKNKKEEEEKRGTKQSPSLKRRKL